MENLSRAVIIPFFNYSHGYDDLLWRFFQLHLKQWMKYTSRVYIIDSGCNIDIHNTLPELTDGKITVITKPVQSHWQNFNEVIRQVPEQNLCLMDSDMIIYHPEIIDTHFKAIENNEFDILTIMDGSGGVSLSQYPVMAENENRFERRRFAPYLCFMKKSILRPDFDFTPRGGDNWTDSMGTVTEQILADGYKVGELPDDRSTIYLEDDGRITSTQWLDSPPKLWALKENPDYGYYHIRNFGGGLKILHEGVSTEPGREARRLGTWVIATAIALQDHGVTSRFWDRFGDGDLISNYVREFRNYHSFLKQYEPSGIATNTG